MSTSIIKKQLLAAALKELMQEKSFSRISVTDICNYCNISRKSFYYHFKDKDDLIEWIFYFECADRLMEENIKAFWTFYKRLADYLSKNRAFYANLAEVSGIHSFQSLLYRFLFENLEKNTHDYFEVNQRYKDVEKQMDCLDFLSTTFMASLKNWITKYPQMTTEEFVEITRFDKLLKE